jgi:hypothetical protein
LDAGLATLLLKKLLRNPKELKPDKIWQNIPRNAVALANRHDDIQAGYIVLKVMINLRLILV